MTLTLKNKILSKAFIFAIVFLPNVLLAQETRTQTLSVSPTLFQMSANPSQSWESEIRVINVNDYEIVVYPQVVNFAPSGESGTGSLIPIFTEETKGTTLAEWVKLSQTEVVIPPQQTATIPFSVTIAQDAAPGGHYAAILIGTKPPEKNGSTQVQTAQFVTSLLFVRVSGDVVENGTIREFSTEKIINNQPNIEFAVRFENTGNVHLQPQGDITITNMWGSERGVIPINYQTHFGNVLPHSIRKFSFNWTGEQSSYDIGRFKAIATLGYGEDTKNFTTSTTYFWVIPVKQILIFGAILLALFWFFSFAIKLYIRRVLVLAGLEPLTRANIQAKNHVEFSVHSKVPSKTVIIRRYQNAIAPVCFSMFELWVNLKSANATKDVIKVIINYLLRNLLSVIFIVMIICVICAGIWFFGDINTKSRPFDVSIINPDATVVISSDEILYRSLPEFELPPGDIKTDEVDFKIALINSSGEPGLAAKTKKKLEAYGYSVSGITNELERSDVKTVIIYNPKNQVAVLELSKKLNSALLSVDTKIEPHLVRIYVGTDNR